MTIDHARVRRDEFLDTTGSRLVSGFLVAGEDAPDPLLGGDRAARARHLLHFLGAQHILQAIDALPLAQRRLDVGLRDVARGRDAKNTSTADMRSTPDTGRWSRDGQDNLGGSLADEMPQ
jgi:hypothetical protein